MQMAQYYLVYSCQACSSCKEIDSSSCLNGREIVSGQLSHSLIVLTLECQEISLIQGLVTTTYTSLVYQETRPRPPICSYPDIITSLVGG